MKIEVLDEKENQLLNRREIRFNVESEGPVPSIADVRKKLTGVLKSKDELTVVDKIKPAFGEKTFQGYAKVYGDAESMKIELESRMKKNFPAKEEPKEESPQAAVAPTEEKAAKEA
ncbi:MAG: 30S ribosomal protein S24e [Candidatus Altiarchaeota archaeon]|nr:30S ribosomal protein S24e [Candidatus Altiarchaeota archaeon]